MEPYGGWGGGGISEWALKEFEFYHEQGRNGHWGAHLLRVGFDLWCESLATEPDGSSFYMCGQIIPLTTEYQGRVHRTLLISI